MREIIRTDTRTQRPAVSPEQQGLLRAQRIAARAHAGQRDKTGRPYTTHCERVANRFSTTEERAVGFLHDTLEKGNGWSASQLREEGFSDMVVEAVSALTRQKDESEHAFLIRIARNPIASRIKIADLEDNIDQCDAAGLDASPYSENLEMFCQMIGISPYERKAEETPRPFMRSLLTELGIVRPDQNSGPLASGVR
ncbi:HD domain-containing protein [Ciceribacter sp. L1K23]|uniref:HD domain-containing protein n=1 Tax=Ciceribacter sp. L1K23 TaxID=2820276 RepID=UPI001B830339|nr:HD domain-containing protein [Ciceribacter sp. L1K23]MBR0557056.1 HD domain-containing protein [Ciceribacter sp. L1K23]